MQHILIYDVKIVYHCFSCKKNFADIELAKEHSKSLCHEVTEEIQGTSRDGKSLLV
jgi:DNA-directed RNA polymerase subunit RPC12/RpoP